MTTWAWERRETEQETAAEEGGAYVFDSDELHADEPALPRFCSVALLGDSTVACRYFPPANRPENHLLVRLQRAFPDQRYVIQNLASAEVEGLHLGQMEQIFAAIPEMHLAFARFNIRQTDEQGFQEQIDNLRTCCEALRSQYPGITVILETGIWIHHPAHFFEEMHGQQAPLYNAMRGWAVEAGYPVVDIYQKMQAEAAKGNWDLRVRGLPTPEQTVVDDSFDEFFGDEPAFFANIHPNSRCLALIAEWEVAMLKLLAKKG